MDLFTNKPYGFINECFDMNERHLAGAKKLSTRVMRDRRRKAIRQVPDLEQVLRGSLMERYLSCGKPGCKCSWGKRHGPVWYLSVTLRAGKTIGMQVPKEKVQRIRLLLENYRKVKEILEAVCEINWELMRRERQASGSDDATSFFCRHSASYTNEGILYLFYPGLRIKISFSRMQDSNLAGT
jgi:hypothetical protein